MSWCAKTYTFSPSTTAASAEVNQNFDDAFTAINTGMPSGGIILWSGSIVSIPSGWYLCNGANSTPDLRDRFIVGAGSSYAVAATGGAASVTLSAAQIPGHTHSGTTGTVSADHGHTFSGTTSGESGHTHVPTGSDAFWCYDASGGETNENLSAGSYTGKKSTTGASSGHTHSYSGTTSGINGNHTHNFTTDAGTGGGGSHENRPPYYSLAFIMKS